MSAAPLPCDPAQPASSAIPSSAANELHELAFDGRPQGSIPLDAERHRRRRLLLQQRRRSACNLAYGIEVTSYARSSSLGALPCATCDVGCQCFVNPHWELAGPATKLSLPPVANLGTASLDSEWTHRLRDLRHISQEFGLSARLPARPSWHWRDGKAPR
jgi:hypothetical protein